MGATVAAGLRHRRAKEPLCDLCAPAMAEYQAEQYANRKARKTAE